MKTNQWEMSRYTELSGMASRTFEGVNRGNFATAGSGILESVGRGELSRAALGAQAQFLSHRFRGIAIS